MLFSIFSTVSFFKGFFFFFHLRPLFLQCFFPKEVCFFFSKFFSRIFFLQRFFFFKGCFFFERLGFLREKVFFFFLRGLSGVCFFFNGV